MNCTVHLRKEACEIWVGTQVPTVTQTRVAALTGLPKDAVVLHNQFLGGEVGRRLEPDGTLLAFKIAKHVDGPVKVIWSREEDIQHDIYRPHYYDRISAGLDDMGNPVAWQHRVCGSSVVARVAPPLFKNGLDFDRVEAAAEPPYAFPNILVDYVRVDPASITTGFWRGVGPVHNVFIVESFIDELAFAAKQDPVAYRRRLLTHNPRALAALNLAVDKAGWGQPMPAGKARGVSLQFAFGSYLSAVAEVAMYASGKIQIERVVCAVDCGLPVNPAMIDAQVQSGIIRTDRGTARDDRDQRWPGGAIQLRHLSTHADRRGSAHRNPHRPEHGKSRRHRRGGDCDHRTSGNECDLHRERTPHQKAADRTSHRAARAEMKPERSPFGESGWGSLSRYAPRGDTKHKPVLRARSPTHNCTTASSHQGRDFKRDQETVRSRCSKSRRRAGCLAGPGSISKQ